MVSGAYCITMRYRLSSKWAGRYNILQYSRKMALRNREQCSCFRRGWFELFNCFTQTSSCCKQLALGRKNYKTSPGTYPTQIPKVHLVRTRVPTTESVSREKPATFLSAEGPGCPRDQRERDNE